jgi:deazaflavin-dependent oxidoreductase (nitroreductase family)
MSDANTVPGRRLAMSNKASNKTGDKPARNDSLGDRLARFRQINISVTGRKSGRTISNPVWFVFEDGKLYLLPVQGSDTQWYKNVLKKPLMRIDARGAEAEVKVVPLTDAALVASVVEKFRAKYGAGDVKKYYAKFDVAVVAQIPGTPS